MQPMKATQSIARSLRTLSCGTHYRYRHVISSPAHTPYITAGRMHRCSFLRRSRAIVVQASPHLYSRLCSAMLLPPCGGGVGACAMCYRAYRDLGAWNAHDIATELATPVDAAVALGNCEPSEMPRRPSPDWRDVMLGMQRSLTEAHAEGLASPSSPLYSIEPSSCKADTERQEEAAKRMQCQRIRADMIQQWKAYVGAATRLVRFSQGISSTATTKQDPASHGASLLQRTVPLDHGAEIDHSCCDAAEPVHRNTHVTGVCDMYHEPQTQCNSLLPVESADACAFVRVLADAVCFVSQIEATKRPHVAPTQDECRIAAAEMTAFVTYLVCHDLQYAVLRLPRTPDNAYTSTPAAEPRHSSVHELAVKQEQPVSQPLQGAMHTMAAFCDATTSRRGSHGNRRSSCHSPASVNTVNLSGCISDVPTVSVSEKHVAYAVQLLHTVSAVLRLDCRSRHARSCLYTLSMSCLGVCEYLTSAEVAELTLCMARCAERYAMEQELRRLRDSSAPEAASTDHNRSSTGQEKAAVLPCSTLYKSNSIWTTRDSCCHAVDSKQSETAPNRSDVSQTESLSDHRHTVCADEQEQRARLLHAVARYYAHPLPSDAMPRKPVQDSGHRPPLRALCFPSQHECDERVEEERWRGGHAMTVTPVTVISHMHVLAHTLHRRISALLDRYHVHLWRAACAQRHKPVGSASENNSTGASEQRAHVAWIDIDEQAAFRAQRRHHAHCATLTLSSSLPLQARQSAAAQLQHCQSRLHADCHRHTNKNTHRATNDDCTVHMRRRELIGEGATRRRPRRTVGELAATEHTTVTEFRSSRRLVATTTTDHDATSRKTGTTPLLQQEGHMAFTGDTASDVSSTKPLHYLDGDEMHVVQLTDVAMMCTALGSVRVVDEAWWTVATRFVCWYVHCYCDDAGRSRNTRILHQFGLLTSSASDGGGKQKGGDVRNDEDTECVLRCVRDVCFALDYVRQDKLYDTIMISLTRHTLLARNVERPSSRRLAIELAQNEQMMPRREGSVPGKIL